MASGGAATYQFGAFRLDPAERLLLREGQPVPLTPKAFDLLVYLVERHGRLVEKRALLTALWPDAIVEEANLASNVSALRKVLDEGRSEDSLIQTVPTKGYRFVAPVTRQLAPQDRLEVPAQSPAIAQDAGGTPARRVVSLRRTLWIAVGLGLLVATAVVGYRVGRLRPPALGSPSATSEARPRLLPVTSLTGWQDWPSLSPDGNQVAFEWAGDQDENPDIYVTLVGAPNVRRLTTDPAMDYAPSWSPDGREIAFLRLENGISRVHLMSALGGPDRVVNDFPAYGKITWSPDGRHIVAGRVAGNAPGRGIYLVPASGGEPRAIAPVAPPAEAHAPAFSPDGRRLAYARCDLIHTQAPPHDFPARTEQHSGGCIVMVVDVNEEYAVQGPPRRLTRAPMAPMGTLAWSRDGRSVVFWGVAAPADSPSNASDDDMDHLWRVAADGSGKTERLEIAGLNARRPTTTAARDRLVFSRSEQDLDIFRFTLGRAPQRVVTSAFEDGHASFSPDGRSIAFSSNRTGTLEIWVAQADGSAPRQLTHDPTRYQASPSWSPDGKTIAFDAGEVGNHQHIWTIPVEGGAPRRLTSEAGQQSVPTWSHDGRWVYYAAGEGLRRDVWRIEAAGGPAQRISWHGSGVVAYESADGQHVVYRRGGPDTPLVETTIGGDDEKILVGCVGSYFGFSVVGDKIYYEPCRQHDASESASVTMGVGVVRVLDRRTARDRVWGVVPNAKRVQLWNPAISPDGTSLLFDRWVSLRANLWLLENFR